MSRSSSWGSLRNTCAASAIAVMFADLPVIAQNQVQAARCFARSQLGYVLGDTGYSFVVGHGHRYPNQVHHRDAACTLAEDAQVPTFCRAGRCAVLLSIHG
jgi:hypothetical protein